MLRSFVALALVAAQLHSWSGSSLYLCLNSDSGFCCIDAGPDSCDCCHREDDACNLEGDSCREHQHEHESPAEQEHGWSTPPCDCVHLLILGERAPVVSRASSRQATSVDGATRWFAANAIALGTRAGEDLRPNQYDTSPLVIPVPSSAVLRCAVLRC